MSATVLVVDDDPQIRTVLALALQDEGYRVLESVDGASLAIARQELPDLVLLDMLMPGMDGVEVSRRLRADPATVRIPVVGMSAHGSRLTFPDLQVDDWLPKPFTLLQLYAVVARWVASPS